MACDFDITKENIYDYIIEDTPGADEAIKALSGICSQLSLIHISEPTRPY